jgi:7,8-dihydropterin-6-yl-methyl-4-(beta-D-ribofuranosyl)aminobenzene 5'-phosphate synthase
MEYGIGMLLVIVALIAGCRATVEPGAGAEPTANDTPAPAPAATSTPSPVTRPAPTSPSSPAPATARARTPAVPAPSPSPVPEITLTVLYDNNPGEAGLATDWGFACLVEGLSETILFDTGGGALLLRNMQTLGIAPSRIDAIILSHAHADHTGGLAGLLAEVPDARVYLLPTFPEELKRRVLDAGAALIEVEGPLEVCPGARVTGAVGDVLPEQALVLDGPLGPVVITGCAHPGLLEMVEAAQAAVRADTACSTCGCGAVELVLGGFHLRDASVAKIEDIVAGLRELGVRRVAPCHCTGDRARGIFEAAYGEDYVAVGVGTRLTLEQPGGFPWDMR